MLKEDIPFKNYDHEAKMAEGFSFTIDREGHWYCHDPAMGVGPIKNERISRLFAGAGSGKYAGKGLSKDQEGKYWLKAPPNDLYGICVEDVPFTITQYRVDNSRLVLMTNFEEEITLDKDKSFIQRGGLLYVEVRNGLFARINRNVFYQLAEQATEKNGYLGILAGNTWHNLGPIT